MSAQPKPLVVDTNIWLDAFFGWREGHADADRLIAYACEHGIKLAFAVTTVKDVFYLASSDLKWHARQEHGELTDSMALACTETAWAIVSNMCEIGVPIGVDIADVWLAHKLRPVHNDLEDNLVIAAAERSDASCIVTSDRQLLANPHVHALTASQMLEHLTVFSRR